MTAPAAPEGTKRCARCKEAKPLAEFDLHNGTPRKNCRECAADVAEMARAQGHAKHPKPETRRCVTCGEEKPYDSFERDRVDCPECRAKEEARKAAARHRPPMPFDQVIADQVLERVACGEPLYRICADEGLPSQHQLHRWKVANPAFATALREARSARADSLVDQMEEVADQVRTGKLDPHAGRVLLDQLRWAAAKADPRYSDRAQVDVTSGGKPLAAASDLDIAKALAHALQAREPEPLDVEVERPAIGVRQ